MFDNFSKILFIFLTFDGDKSILIFPPFFFFNDLFIKCELVVVTPVTARVGNYFFPKFIA